MVCAPCTGWIPRLRPRSWAFKESAVLLRVPNRLNLSGSASPFSVLCSTSGEPFLAKGSRVWEKFRVWFWLLASWSPQSSRRSSPAIRKNPSKSSRKSSSPRKRVRLTNQRLPRQNSRRLATSNPQKSKSQTTNSYDTPANSRKSPQRNPRIPTRSPRKSSLSQAAHSNPHRPLHDSPRLGRLRSAAAPAVTHRDCSFCPLTR